MSTLLRVLGGTALLTLAAQSRAQYAPPDANVNGGGGGIALPPAPSGGAIDLSPPANFTPALPRNDAPLVIPRADQAMTTDAMIGYVNDEPVFLSDLFRPIDASLRQVARTANNISEFKDGARVLIRNQLSSLVSDVMVVSVAQAQLTQQEKDRIDIFLNLERSKIISEHGGSGPAADRALQAMGSSVEKELRDKRRKWTKDLYFQKNLLPHVVVTRQMVLDAYERTPKQWQQVAQVELFTITLPITNWLRDTSGGLGEKGPIIANPTGQQIKDAETQAVATGKEIIAKLKAGADFARLVEDYDSRDEFRTIGGSRGLINRGSMQDTKLEDYVFSLPAKTIGDPILSHEANFRDSTMKVVRVGIKKEARTIPFEEAQAQLFDDLRQQQLQDLQSQEMAKLAQGAAIEAVDRMQDVALDAAVTRYAMR